MLYINTCITITKLVKKIIKRTGCISREKIIFSLTVQGFYFEKKMFYRKTKIFYSELHKTLIQLLYLNVIKRVEKQPLLLLLFLKINICTIYYTAKKLTNCAWNVYVFFLNRHLF